MAIEQFLANRVRPTVDQYVNHPYAAREGVAEFANNPSSARNPQVLSVLAQHHETQAAALEAKGRAQYSDPNPGNYGEASERASHRTLNAARGHREAAQILRAL